MRLVCMRASRSITGIDGGTNSISRTILAADSGIDRSIALRSRPAGNGFLRLVLAFALVGGARGHVGDQVADVHHADRVVERVVIDDEPRMRGALEHLHQLAERDLLLHRDDVGARHHHVHGAPLAQAEDVPQHGAFARREAGVAGAALQHAAQVGAERFRLPAEQRPQRPREPAFAVRRAAASRRRHRHRQIARSARGWRA